jgi:3-methyladenine DNA glycosylase AlkD
VSPTAALRAKRRELTKRMRDASGLEVIEAALREPERLIAYELIAFHREAMALLDEPLLTRLAGALGSWADVDMFSVYLAGPAWRAGQITDAAIARWAKSPDRWWRRAALVATVPLNMKSRGGTGDASRTLRVCGMLLDDRDDMVVKAMSWALRELSKRDAGAVRAFLAVHDARLAARVKREARGKLETGRKP